MPTKMTYLTPAAPKRSKIPSITEVSSTMTYFHPKQHALLEALAYHQALQ